MVMARGVLPLRAPHDAKEMVGHPASGCTQPVAAPHTPTSALGPLPHWQPVTQRHDSWQPGIEGPGRCLLGERKVQRGEYPPP